jgi:hypothetical protein
MKMDSQSFTLHECKTGKLFFYLSLLGILACITAYIADRQQFFYSYLVAFVFWTTISLGALFFTLLQHVTGARWSIVLRRLAENAMKNLPFMVVLFIPLLFGLSEIYHWMRPEVMAADPLLQKKAAYLNKTFFLIRTGIYFLV